jgi:hypothetical protein
MHSEEREKQKKYLKQYWPRIFPKLILDTKPQIQHTQRTPGKINAPQKCTGVYHIQMTQNQSKEKFMKEARR